MSWQVMLSVKHHVEGKKALIFLGSRFYTGSIKEVVCNIPAETQGRFKYVVTPNVQHVVRLLDNPGTMQPLYEDE